MKASELRELSLPELKEKLRELREELLNLRFQKSIYQLENPMRIRQVKRDIARILTVIREKELQMG
ncbi:MAG: 50S ribosomal protein L29 [Thermodesulfatator sp.]|nr:MAG: 50S ribosomal protein L29 [Thermodesulfatator sp.]